VAGGDHDPARVAGVDLGIIHPYAVMAGDEGLLVSGRQIRSEERLHLEDTKRRAQKAAAKARGRGQRGSRRWRRYRAARRRARPATAAGSARPTTRRARSVVSWLVDHEVGTWSSERSQGHHHQGLRAPPEPGAAQLRRTHLLGCLFGQGGGWPGSRSCS